ncbi:tRNA uridine-5-carboxymethylaminomethyl(34) synthesis GTPase MnmE [Sphingomicrobium astaxanthinifaciens]|uniref:tRNA uridine-5-carboxymethylaminomethyl(34) synthesis GTPase MnmE n=1 Tax=Sphingomicrobium astaxanthinifaciens TaxID=1227949 RepID=UPI001FCAF913|nr:tRNA uridine-5-carboxymethylaminomethyl(34) synthesis GTPase MnmE [Sphingomicrobium astaxanthinifaciens]MCJ7421177.1 tRNA uridine-5-carboxymethylaminomethyl(34) synthesis GTPase MnmE [Sphingomicrobium astaxanthinifaciens]
MSGGTIVALSSGALPAAIAIVRASGPDAFAGAAMLGASPEAARARYARLRDPADDSLLDEALVLGFRAPHSATGEDIVEYQVHGSRAVVDRLLDLLTARAGTRLAAPGEFTRRALANGKMDLIAAEALGDLLHAETELQRKVALRQYRTGLGQGFAALEARLIDLSAQAEAAIDYVGDEEETGRIAHLEAAITALRGDVEALLALPERRPLQDGIRLVLAGPVNAGKSSLFNTLAGYDRAIVSGEAGTTRDTIELPLRIDGIAYLLVDTAGWRSGAGTVEAEGIARARSAVDEADILLWLGAPDAAPPHPHCLAIAAKADLALEVPAGAIAVSAHTGVGIPALFEAIAEHARALLPSPDEATLNRRQRAQVRAMADALEGGEDPVLLAEQLRAARLALAELRGDARLDDVLDRIFGKFCLGK